jgi:hypothetical protein
MKAFSAPFAEHAPINTSALIRRYTFAAVDHKVLTKEEADDFGGKISFLLGGNSTSSCEDVVFRIFEFLYQGKISVDDTIERINSVLIEQKRALTFPLRRRLEKLLTA